VRPVVTDDPAGTAAERIAGLLRPGAQMALAGGSTPRAAYGRLADMSLEWTGVGLWFSDERAVPPGDERSNYRMAKEALLDRLSQDGPEVQRIQGERGPHEAAADYEAALRERLGANGGTPSLELCLLGLGPDVHCASLFPRDPALEERDRLVVGVEAPGMEPMVPRVTFTLPMINACREVMFLVAGADKAEAVARAWAGPPGPDAPASLVAPATGELTVVMDAPAAARLEAVGSP
jgi:6-phosphogluconolactonase